MHDSSNRNARWASCRVYIIVTQISIKAASSRGTPRHLISWKSVQGHGTCGAHTDRQNMASIKGTTLELFFANALKGCKLPCPFRVVSLGETQSLKPVVRIHTRLCLLEQSPVQAIARILRPLLTAMWGQSMRTDIVTTEFRRDSESNTCSETTERSPMDGGDEGAWDYHCSSFWPASTSPKSLSLAMAGKQGRRNSLWGMWRSLIHRTSSCGLNIVQ